MAADTHIPPMRRRYEDPPVVEAIARFAWSEPTTWNVTTPGLLFDRVREFYPEEPQVKSVMQADFRPGAEDGAEGANFQFMAGPQRMIYGSEGGSRQLTVGPQDISVHGMPPYEGWEALEGRLFRDLEAVDPVLDVLGRTVATMGLRYVNRIVVPRPSFSFEEYLTVSIGFPPEFPTEITAFLDRAELRYPNEPVRLHFTWASIEAEPGSSAFIIDLDLYRDAEEPVRLEEARSGLADLKLKEGRAFESLLQDSVRELFNEIRQ